MAVLKRDKLIKSAFWRAMIMCQMWFFVIPVLISPKTLYTPRNDEKSAQVTQLIFISNLFCTI